jgi:hypothetical protein
LNAFRSSILAQPHRAVFFTIAFHLKALSSRAYPPFGALSFRSPIAAAFFSGFRGSGDPSSFSPMRPSAAGSASRLMPQWRFGLNARQGMIKSSHKERVLKAYSFELNFMDDRKSELPRPPIAEVGVARYSQRTQDGPLIITPECVSMEELDFHIDRLKNELEILRSSARAKFLADSQRGRSPHVHSTE